jgi:uncharacterized SAM-binding protein YcdF (DUF218 family)
MEPPDLDAIAAYLDVQSAPAAADIALVFGTRLPDPAHVALDLYARRLVPLIALTGGINRIDGLPEAHRHRDILVAGGVPIDAIMVEERSTNTLENVQCALPLIAERLPLASITRVLVVAKWFHSRRAVMTLKRHMPAGVRYYPVTYAPPGLERGRWRHDDAARAAVLKNWDAIPRYLARGHLAEIAADGDAFV